MYDGCFAASRFPVVHPCGSPHCCLGVRGEGGRTVPEHQRGGSAGAGGNGQRQRLVAARPDFRAACVDAGRRRSRRGPVAWSTVAGRMNFDAASARRRPDDGSSQVGVGLGEATY